MKVEKNCLADVFERPVARRCKLVAQRSEAAKKEESLQVVLGIIQPVNVKKSEHKVSQELCGIGASACAASLKPPRKSKRRLDLSRDQSKKRDYQLIKESRRLLLSRRRPSF